MAPVNPHWHQPSHPDVQEVAINNAEYTSKSFSKVTLPPFAVFARLDFPPCTTAVEPTYATVQMGRNKHLNLNSDLLYINHSCEPSLIFDTGNLAVLAGPNGINAGEELTFFYPSTEWDMAQPFACLCGKITCRGTIGGAKDMTPTQLAGIWLNGHIRELLEEQSRGAPGTNGALLKANSADPTAEALKDALAQAEKVVDAARLALQSYVERAHKIGLLRDGKGTTASGVEANGVLELAAGLDRRGPTSRELSGEMSGDTVVV